jgi:TPR repeat protein
MAFRHFAVSAVLLAGPSSFAMAQTTLPNNNASCQVPPPADIAAPATPSVAAGVAAARNNNFAMARANFKPLAEAGDTEAERLYGTLLMQKCTGMQDAAAGAIWLGKSADGGNVQAAAQLGQAYMNGDGVPQDDNKAFALVSKAADGGIVGAEVNLGYFYLSGRGVAADPYQGMVWSAKAGEQGAAPALANIAQAYFRGKVLPQDNDKAIYYINIAMLKATPAQRAAIQTTIDNIQRAVSAEDFKREAARAERWSPGKGSLSDVVDDAARMRDKAAKN